MSALTLMNGLPMNQNDKNIEARKKYVSAFNSTLLRMWAERINLLQVWDTGGLYRSIRRTDQSFNADVSEVSLGQSFRTYGLWVNYGVGRETPRGNPGDIGRAKVRKAKKWFDPKYFSSVYNIRDFMAESFSQQAIAIFTDAFSDRTLRANATLP